MNNIYPVDWKPLLKSVLSVCILSLVTIFGLIFILHGFDHAKAFPHFSFISLVYILIILVGISLLLVIFAKISPIKIRDGWLHGRNYWCLSKRIPLDEIVYLKPFSSNGINCIIAETEYLGSIYIPIHTIGLDELIKVIEHHMKPY